MPRTGAPHGYLDDGYQCSTTMRLPTGVQRSVRSSSKTITITPSFSTASPSDLRWGSLSEAVPSLRISQVSTTPLANSTLHSPAGSARSGAGALPAEARANTKRAREADRRRGLSMVVSWRKWWLYFPGLIDESGGWRDAWALDGKSRCPIFLFRISP